MAEKDGEDLASVLEQALAEAEARARDRGKPTPGDETLPSLSEAVRRSGSGLHQVDESGLPPVRRRVEQPRGLGEILRDELPNGRAWAVAWIVLRELAALVGFFWLALIIVSFAAPDGGFGLGVFPLSVLLAVVFRLLLLAVSTFLPER